jgi:hypothetical protein
VFVLNPDKYLLPDYKISPFQTKDIELNAALPDDDFASNYFSQRFEHQNFLYTLNGRQALNIALSRYTLNKNDVVTILTTTQNFYISSCVTNEVEKFCTWNRSVTQQTRIILVIHEFGYPFPDLESLRKYNLPIIEDCAYAFFSESKEYKMGSVGDYSIYSFPKMLPIQVGGLVVSNGIPLKDSELSFDVIQYMKNVLSHYLRNKEALIDQRLKNYEFLRVELKMQNYLERFPLMEGVVPGVFMFRSERKIEWKALKEHVANHGIQCSIFYGEDSFFIPVHHALNENDLNYILAVIKFVNDNVRYEN